MNCVFCRIIDGSMNAKKRYEDEDMIIIEDLFPKAKIHLLLIPKQHYKLLSLMDDSQALVLGKCLKRLSELENELGLSEGYRLIVNQGLVAGQTIGHLHIHILGGQELPFEDFTQIDIT